MMTSRLILTFHCHSLSKVAPQAKPVPVIPVRRPSGWGGVFSIATHAGLKNRAPRQSLISTVCKQNIDV